MSPILSIHHPASQPVTSGQNFGEQQPVKASFVEYDDVAQALSANGSDDAFDISTLPRRTRRGQHLLRGR
jgi:hypothetical protein